MPFTRLLSSVGVLERAVRVALVENGFGFCRTDALDAAQGIGIGGVDVDGRECGTDRHGERERCDYFLDHLSLSLEEPAGDHRRP